MVSILYGKPGNSESYQRYILCKEFHWDFETYESQPNFWIDEILVIMHQEAQKQEKDAEKNKPKSNKLKK